MSSDARPPRSNGTSGETGETGTAGAVGTSGPNGTVRRVDAVVVGAGIAGSAAARGLARAGRSVVLLERQDRHGDLVRGEWLTTWGVTEARRLGLEPTLRRAGARTMRWWPHWDETVDDPGDPPVWDLSTFVEGVDGPLTFAHHRACVEMCADAVAAGARVEWGARDLGLVPGAGTNRVTWRVGDRQVGVDARFVIGAGGRAAPVGRLIGSGSGRYVHHWGGGLAVSGLEGWPEDTQAVGTEGPVMFFVFPQGEGRARLYLSYASADRQRFAGPGGLREFLGAFRLACLPRPHAAALASAVPAGPLATLPSSNSWATVIRRGGVVLVGDEAGAINPVVGTGLASSLRDARLVVEAITGDDPDVGLALYVREHAERMRRLRIVSDFQVTLMAEFGPAARARRAEAWRRAREDNRLATLMMATYVAPELLPEFAFHPSLRERLVGREMADHLRSLEVAGV